MLFMTYDQLRTLHTAARKFGEFDYNIYIINYS